MSTVYVGRGNDIAIMCGLGRGRSNPPWANVRQHGAGIVIIRTPRAPKNSQGANGARDRSRAPLSSGRPTVLRYRIPWTAQRNTARITNARPSVALLIRQHAG